MMYVYLQICVDVIESLLCDMRGLLGSLMFFSASVLVPHLKWHMWAGTLIKTTEAWQEDKLQINEALRSILDYDHMAKNSCMIQFNHNMWRRTYVRIFDTMPNLHFSKYFLDLCIYPIYKYLNKKTFNVQ